MRCGLLGKSLSHSLSPQIHKYLGDYEYRLINVDEAGFDDFMRAREFDGLNVTIPYKKAVLPYCDELSAAARETGSVNTIVNRGGRLFGDNTDIFGFGCQLDRAGADIAGKKVLVLGDGGVAQTVKYVLGKRGARQIITVSRRAGAGVTYDEMYADHADADAIVNTTPVGMYPDNYRAVIDIKRFGSCGFVADMIYNPLRTRLLLEAAALGMRVSGGLSMLAAQAFRAAEIFLDKPLPPSLPADILKELTASQQNIVLIGMPGSGKSSVAAELAALTGREVLNTDTLIEQAAAATIPDIFAAQGEPGFRRLESEAVRAAAKQLGKIISVGGGAPLAPENRAALAQNGVVVFLRRDIANLSTDGRPLSKDTDTLLHMWAERLPVYEGMADVSVEITEGEVKGTAERVLSAVSAYDRQGD